MFRPHFSAPLGRSGTIPSRAPIAAGSFKFFALPNWMQALKAAGIPFDVSLETESAEKPKLLKTGAAHVIPGLHTYLVPAVNAERPIAFEFSAAEQKTYNDYGGANVNTTVIQVWDANGKKLLDTSVGSAMKRRRAVVHIDPKAHPSPWHIFQGGSTKFRFMGTKELLLSTSPKGLLSAKSEKE
tara:strand:+ start:511 stop:1062 length:552 start_codon:yes stop_codon:yes gene_type:complete